MSVCVSHLADTFVVKETQSVTKDNGVVPVMSSHCAGDVPPAGDGNRSAPPLYPSACFCRPVISFCNQHPSIKHHL